MCLSSLLWISTFLPYPLNQWYCNKCFSLSKHIWWMGKGRLCDVLVAVFICCFIKCKKYLTLLYLKVLSDSKCTHTSLLYQYHTKPVYIQLWHLKSTKILESDFIVINSGSTSASIVTRSSITFSLHQIDCHKKRHTSCCYPQYSILYRTRLRTSTTPLLPQPLGKLMYGALIVSSAYWGKDNCGLWERWVIIHQ